MKESKKIIVDTDNEPLIFSKSVIDLLLQQKKYRSELIGLYTFYYYTGKWQKTNQPKATSSYVSKGLGWNEDKVRKIKKELIKLSLIKDIIYKDPITKKIKGHYIQVEFIWGKQAVTRIMNNYNKKQMPQKTTLPGNPEGGFDPGVVSGGANTLSVNNKNTLSVNNKVLSKDNTVQNKKEEILSSKNKKDKKYLDLSKELKEIIQENKKVNKNSSTQRWSKEIKNLIEKDLIEDTWGKKYKRVKNALLWYKENINNQYTPVIESGTSLRKKFTSLENQMNQDKKINKDNKSSRGEGLSAPGIQDYNKLYNIQINK